MLGSSRAQPLPHADPEVMLELAVERSTLSDYYHALEWYERAYAIRHDTHTALQIARMHQALRDPVHAVEWYRRVLDEQPDLLSLEMRLDYARELKKVERYSQAERNLRWIEEHSQDEKLLAHVQIELEGIYTAQSLNYYKNIELERLPEAINNRFSEYSPVLTRESLIYVGWNADDIYTYARPRADLLARLRLVPRVDITESPQIGLMTDIPSEPGWHHSHYAEREDGRLRFISMAQIAGGDVVGTRVYAQEKDGETWSPARLLAPLGHDILMRHVDIMQDGDKTYLLFASDLRGRRATLDLYRAEYYGNGRYGSPIALGDQINTDRTENHPHYREGILYFSSDGHPGIGGLDIYSSRWDGNHWSRPIALGRPINSSYDDQAYRIDLNENQSIWLSNRPGGNSFKSETCCDDIFIARYAPALSVPDTSQPVIEREAPTTLSHEKKYPPTILPRVYWPLDEVELDAEDKEDLNLLRDQLRLHPSWVVELSVHTDARGDAVYNQKLTDRRALKIDEYLSTLSIDTDRYSCVGMGESQPMNRCVDGSDCRSAEYAINNRVEFRVIRDDYEAPLPPEAPAEQTEFPILEFEKSFIDYGVIREGDVVIRKFRFKNVGSSDLVIELASACECTDLSWPQNPITPGGTGEIEARYRSAGRVGEQEVTIDMITNTRSIVEQARFRVFVKE